MKLYVLYSPKRLQTSYIPQRDHPIAAGFNTHHKLKNAKVHLKFYKNFQRSVYLERLNIKTLTDPTLIEDVSLTDLNLGIRPEKAVDSSSISQYLALKARFFMHVEYIGAIVVLNGHKGSPEVA